MTWLLDGSPRPATPPEPKAWCEEWSCCVHNPEAIRLGEALIGQARPTVQHKGKEER